MCVCVCYDVAFVISMFVQVFGNWFAFNCVCVCVHVCVMCACVCVCVMCVCVCVCEVLMCVCLMFYYIMCAFTA